MTVSGSEEPLAEAIAEKVSLSAEARNLLRKDQLVLDYIRLLIAEGKHQDAVHMVANLLPKREAVWWATQTARQTAPDPLPAELEKAIAASEKWVTELSDESRRACWSVGNKAGVETAAGSVAIATYFSGGSMGPPDQEPIAPDELITGKMVATSILLSVLKAGPDERSALFENVLDQGMNLYRSLSAQPQRD
jgi:hypothetical protein